MVQHFVACDLALQHLRLSVLSVDAYLLTRPFTVWHVSKVKWTRVGSIHHVSTTC